MADKLVLHDMSIERAEMLKSEIGKVRCWLLGYYAGISDPKYVTPTVPGDDSLRQMQIILDDAIGRASRK